jgi:hypothetical protein
VERNKGALAAQDNCGGNPNAKGQRPLLEENDPASTLRSRSKVAARRVKDSTQGLGVVAKASVMSVFCSKS